MPLQAQHYRQPVSASLQRLSNVVVRLRLASGLLLFTFVATHLLNHALGLISLAAMEAGRHVFLAVWRNPVGTGLLLAAIVIHLGQAFWSIYRRRHMRMPAWQMVQLGLGVCIPVVLVNHVVATYGASVFYGYEDSYTMAILVYWKLRPALGISQSVLLLVAWTHGCIGVHYWLRLRVWYQRVRMPLYTLAILFPVLALLGFVQAGRYVALLAFSPPWVQQTIANAQPPNAVEAAMLSQVHDSILLALGLLLLLTFAARGLRQFHEAGRSVRITYPGERVVTVPKGFSVLESSRQAGIAHASVCGGRGRCSNCRVRVLFADLRGFTSLSERRLPYDVVFLLNRYFEAVGSAIDQAGGVANQFTGDGVMALFGLTTGPAEGARQAIAAALRLQRAVARLSAELHEELPEPLQLGIGIHCGPTVVGHMGRGVATYLTAVGDTVNLASRLQDQTKQFGCQLVISSPVARRAGVDVSAFRYEEITVRNRDAPIGVYVIVDVATLPADALPA